MKTTFALSKAAFYADFLTVPAATTVAVFWMLSLHVFEPKAFASAVIAGFIGWTFIEYAAHRWVLHRTFRGEHREHHIVPEEYIGVSPISTAVIGALSFWFLTTTCGPVMGVGLLVGLVAGYLSYLFVHDRCHHGTVRGGSYLATLNSNHIYHHSRYRVNYGVITPAWDYIFGTYQINPVKPLNEL